MTIFERPSWEFNLYDVRVRRPWGVPRDIKQIEQGWNSRNFIGFFSHFLLRQYQSGVCSKGTDPVDRRRRVGRIGTVAQGFPINGDDFAWHGL